MSENDALAQTQQDVSNAVWTHAGRSTVGFVRIRDTTPASLGSGTLIRFGEIVGILTCAHVLEALAKEDEIGILCFPVRATQVQRLQLNMATTNNLMVGTPPWNESGPDLGFLRLPISIVGDIERLATVANGDVHRRNIISGEPAPARKFCVVAGVVDEFTKSPIFTEIPGGVVATRPFEALMNLGHMIVDDEAADRIRFQPIASPHATRPSSYKGTSGGGMWVFFLNDDFTFAQARLVGVAYWEKSVVDELHIIGHGQISIYDTLFNAIRDKWP